MNKCCFLILILLLLSRSGISQYSKIDEKIYFDSDKYELNDSEKEKLIKLLDSVNTDSITRLFITGHTDNSADSLYNILLSENRCKTVRDFLISKNLNKNIFTINYFGENKPIAPNSTDSGKQENRRVDIRIIYKITNQIQDVDTIPLGIDTCVGIDTTIILENGTELVFNKCEYLEIQECLEIKSIRTTDELIGSGIQLITDDNIPLITCGMISICLNSNCVVKKSCFDYPVKVRFPFPSDEKCLPCDRRVAGVFNMNRGGRWAAADRKNEKIEIVTIGKLKYYQLEVTCPNCEMKNCDCPMCEDLPIKEMNKVCPKVKIKLPRRYTLILANIYIDCPPTFVTFNPLNRKLIPRKNIGKTRTKCYEGEHRIQVLALNSKGDTIRIENRPLDDIKHRILFSRCKLDEPDNQKVFILFPAKKRAFYRKYKIVKEDFN
jgi:hypothetical protein